MSSRLDVSRVMNGRLSAEQFRSLARARGYSLAALARLWGLTRARLSQIASDPARAAHYDFALQGTPRRRGHERAAPRRGAALQSAVPSTEPTPALEVGEVFVVRDSPGQHLPEGEEGIVIALDVACGCARALLRFGGGAYEESFELPYLLGSECFLVRTGRLQG